MEKLTENLAGALAEWLARLERGREWQRQARDLAAWFAPAGLPAVSEASTLGRPSEQELRMLLMGAGAAQRFNNLSRQGRPSRSALPAPALFRPGAAKNFSAENLSEKSGLEKNWSENDRLKAKLFERNPFKENLVEKISDKEITAPKNLVKDNLPQDDFHQAEPGREDLFADLFDNDSRAEILHEENPGKEPGVERSETAAEITGAIQKTPLKMPQMTVPAGKKTLAERNLAESVGAEIAGSLAWEPPGGLAELAETEIFSTPVSQFRPAAQVQNAVGDNWPAAGGTDVDSLAELVAERLRDDIEALLGSASLV